MCSSKPLMSGRNLPLALLYFNTQPTNRAPFFVSNATSPSMLGFLSCPWLAETISVDFLCTHKLCHTGLAAIRSGVGQHAAVDRFFSFTLLGIKDKKTYITLLSYVSKR